MSHEHCSSSRIPTSPILYLNKGMAKLFRAVITISPRSPGETGSSPSTNLLVDYLIYPTYNTNSIRWNNDDNAKNLSPLNIRLENNWCMSKESIKRIIKECLAKVET